LEEMEILPLHKFDDLLSVQVVGVVNGIVTATGFQGGEQFMVTARIPIGGFVESMVDNSSHTKTCMDTEEYECDGRSNVVALDESILK
ncbi:hypothetical protein PMAYCL1PPCAC_28784, partial [Pristionchus mayeri]